MKNNTLLDELNTATYCPEDDKLRLYVGRVPRPEYDALRAEGWTPTPKQSDAGQGEFAAIWTPDREDTALSYAGFIDDEDAGPADRAADRAERFGGFCDTHLDRADGHADAYDERDSAHGFQSKARAVRSADRHDRLADRALTSWDKAEYWQRRTSGVISNALYKSSPGVRMGRIKTLEAELRKAKKSHEDYARNFRNWVRLAAIEDPEQQTAAVLQYPGTTIQWGSYRHPRAENLSEYYQNNDTSLYSLVSHEADPITGAEACAFFFSDTEEPNEDTRAMRHLRNRLAYENQMIEAQGGRAADIEMEVGGFLGGKQIHKVSKSPVTGRVVSVQVKGPSVGRWTYQAENVKGTDYALYKFDTERMAPGAYRAPTDEERVAYHAMKKAEKAAAPKSTAPSLINPTLADAERLQAVWNARAEAKHPGRTEAQTVICISQATYSGVSGGTYTDFKTRTICEGGRFPKTHYGEEDQTGAVCKVRTCYGKGGFTANAYRVIHITDKPAKAFPAAMWATTPAAPEVVNAR